MFCMELAAGCEKRGVNGEVATDSVLFDPALEPNPIFLQQEAPGPEAFPKYPVRLRIPRGTADPLWADFVLGRCEPALRQNFHQSSMEVEDEERHGGIVGALG